MSTYGDFDKFQILILGGFPRAGTRQFTDILNQHSEICIKGECYNNSLKMLGDTFEQADVDHKGKWSEKSYFANRTFSALNAYACISKGNNNPFDFTNKKVVGFKKPRIEIQRKSIEKLLSPCSKIVFFYCVRNLQDNFLSENSTFNISAEKYIQQTGKSLDGLMKMMKSSKFEPHIISLDEFIQSENKGVWLYNNLFSRLPLGNTKSEECQNFLDLTTNRNATKVKGKVRKTFFSEELYQLFDNSLSFKAKVLEFEKLSGKTIWPW